MRNPIVLEQVHEAIKTMVEAKDSLGFVVASQSYTVTGTTYTLNFTGNYNGTATIEYTYVLTVIPIPPPPPASPPYTFSIDNVQLYYNDTVSGYDTICTNSSGSYRWGFNGHEKDNEVKGAGNWYTFGDYGYDPRIIQRPSQDPKWWKYPDRSPYAVFNNNPIFYVDYDGNDPVDPRSGGKFKIDLWNHSVIQYEFATTYKKVTDKELKDRIPTWTGKPRSRNRPDGMYDGAKSFAANRTVTQISQAALDIINNILPQDKYKTGSSSTYGAPNDQVWGMAADNGSYTFMDELAENDWTRIDYNERNIYKVEENYITQIINLKRGPDDKFNINSITSFSIDKGEIKKSFLFFEWTEKQKYRTLTVTESTETYKDNKSTGTTTIKTYTKEEIID